ncbi:MAG: hypothetical protein RJA17_1390 [Pseudomonadota bacterium]
MTGPAQQTSFDYVIVGAGSAGCLLANRLSANPAHRVLLLEAGGPDDWFWIKVPVGYLFTIANPRTDWCFKTEPDPGLDGRSIHYARGRVIGGCSSINAMIYMRGQASDYARWQAATGDDRWAWGTASSGQTLATLMSLEDYFEGANPWHGQGGEMRVESPRVRWPILEAWQRAAQEQGIPAIAEFNRGDNFGSAYFHVTQRRGRRWSMADAFLHPIAHRPNLTIWTHAQALGLQFCSLDQAPASAGAWTGARQRACGVTVLHNGNKVSVAARKEVILSAGAIGSPQLLQVSGIGPAGLMRSHQIPIVADLPGVGENLQDHLQIRTVYKVRHATTVNGLYRSLWGRAKMGLDYLLFRRGPMTMPPSTLGAFGKSHPGVESADLEWHVQPLSLPAFGQPLHPFDAITPSVCYLRPSSRGVVAITQPDPLAAPKIDCRYLSTEEDLQASIRGLEQTRAIMASPALAAHAPEEFLPGPDRTTEAQLAQAARELGTTIFHPVGTCTMGRINAQGHADDPRTVLDSDCRLRGVAGLRVVDASAMPLITSGNTNTPVMLIAARAAESILSETHSS